MLIKPVQVWDRKLRKVNHCPIFLNLPILDPQPYFNQPSYPDLPLYLYSTFLSSTHCPISLYLPILDPLAILPQLTYPRPTDLSPPNLPILDPLTYFPPILPILDPLSYLPQPTYLRPTVLSPPNLPILDPLPDLAQLTYLWTMALYSSVHDLTAP